MFIYNQNFQGSRKLKDSHNLPENCLQATPACSSELPNKNSRIG
jgi:hypothetical protein